MMNDFVLIAHRGACLEETEDTLAALERGAAYGAFAVECDPRLTRDGVYVLFHDADLARLAGDSRRVDALTLDEMRVGLARAGKTLTTLDELLSGYRGASAVLFDLPDRALDEALYVRLSRAPFRAIMGVHAVEEAALAAKYFAPRDVLAFMLSTFLSEPGMARAFADAGAGHIRLWEDWLDTHPIPSVRDTLPADRDVWIMLHDRRVRHPLYSMNGSPESLDRVRAEGASGALLNDIAMGVRHLCASAPAGKETRHEG